MNDYQYCKCGKNKVLAGYISRELSSPSQPIHMSFTPVELPISEFTDIGKYTTVLSPTSRCPVCEKEKLDEDYTRIPESY